MKLYHFKQAILVTTHQEACISFYTTYLGMDVHPSDFGVFLQRGEWKIHVISKEQAAALGCLYPKEGRMTICLEVENIESVYHMLSAQKVPLMTSIISHRGARGPMQSVYLQDPDGHVIELSQYMGGEKKADLFWDNDESKVDE